MLGDLKAVLSHVVALKHCKSTDSQELCKQEYYKFGMAEDMS